MNDLTKTDTQLPADAQKINTLLFNQEAMQQLESFAEEMSKGVATVPKHLQGSKSDCMAVIMQAAQWGMNPYAVGQKTHLVNGVLGYEAQLVNAVISSSKAIRGRFKYEYDGEWKSDKDPTACVRAGAVLNGESEITWGEWLYPANLTTKNSPLWKTSPKQQSAYVAVKYWARLYCPDVILGVYTADELVDVEPEFKDVSPLQQKLSSTPSDKPAIEAEPAKQPEIPAELITLQSVIEEIEEAKDEDQLTVAAGYAGKLNKGDQEQARKSYRLRLAELRGEQIDPKEDGGFIITTADGKKIEI